MAVTISTNTLSARVRYLNVSPSTVNADAKDVILAVANALIALGWSRFDTAGETSVIGTSADAGVVLRRECYDFADSGHYNYLGLRLTGTSDNTYTLFTTQAAGWSSTTSMSSFVAGATGNSFTPNSTGRTNFLNFAQGGTIWLFDSGKTLLMTSQSGATLTKTADNIWIIGEYKKDFSENVNAATGYIHNGVFTNSTWLLNGSGQTPARNGHLGVSNIEGSVNQTSVSANWDIRPDIRRGMAVNGYLGSFRVDFQAGSNQAQFILTEAPLAATVDGVFSNNAGAPGACNGSFTTRLLMGYLGWVGYVTPFHMLSVNFVLGAGATSTHVAVHAQTAGVPAMPFSAYASATQNHVGSYLQEYAMNNLDGGLKFTVFEPTLSTGTTSRLRDTANSSFYGGSFGGDPRPGAAPDGGTYTGPQYKFSMLGRIFDMKIFGPYSSEKYNLLDVMTIPCNADGFYQEGGTDKDFWIIPSGNNMAYVMPK
jgi:hypothetical protein